MLDYIVYILDPFSYIETSIYKGQPSRQLSFLLSLKKSDIAFVPNSLRDELEKLVFLNNTIYSKIFWINDNNKVNFYNNIEANLKVCNIANKYINVITYSYSNQIEYILKKNNLSSFYNLILAKELNSKSNVVLNSPKIKTLQRVIVNNLKGIEKNYNKTCKDKYKGIVIKKNIDELGIGNVFVEDCNKILISLNEIDIKIDGSGLLNEKVIVEPWLNENYIHLNYQFVINRTNKNGLLFLGASIQYFSYEETDSFQKVFFEGNIGPTIIENEHYNEALRVSNEIANKGYFGVVGVDLYFKDEDYGVMEFNCRFNSATSLYYYNINIKNILENRFWLMKDVSLFDIDINVIDNFLIKNNLYFNKKKRNGIIIFLKFK